jgi:hypothetical protein
MKFGIEISIWTLLDDFNFGSCRFNISNSLYKVQIELYHFSNMILLIVQKKKSLERVKIYSETFFDMAYI